MKEKILLLTSIALAIIVGLLIYGWVKPTSSLSGAYDTGFARGTIGQATITTAVSTNVFATSTEISTASFRSLTNITGVEVYCAVGEDAVLEKGIVVPASTTITFCSKAECDVNTYGTVNCISNPTGTLATFVKKAAD